MMARSNSAFLMGGLLVVALCLGFAAAPAAAQAKCVPECKNGGVCTAVRTEGPSCSPQRTRKPTPTSCVAFMGPIESSAAQLGAFGDARCSENAGCLTCHQP
jgi:hypothetical protein